MFASRPFEADLQKAVDWNTCRKEWPHLRSIDFPEVSYHDVVEILIGLDAIHLHSAMEEIYREPGEPVARCTPLGWTCVGSPEKCLSSELSRYVQSFHVHTSADLNYALRKFSELDAIGMNNDNNEVYTPAEKDAEHSPTARPAELHNVKPVQFLRTSESVLNIDWL